VSHLRAVPDPPDEGEGVPTADPATAEDTPPTPVPGPPEADAWEPRRYPSTIGGAFYLLVLGIVFVGIGISAFGDWREGVRWIGMALLLAAGVRLVLRRQDAGMLAVRHRLVDVGMLAVTGAALIFLAGSIPEPPVL
jgi:Protein of unknown function (DUF3017)